MGAQVSASIAEAAQAVTPSDTADNYFNYLYVGTGGDVVVDGEAGGTTIVHKNVASCPYFKGIGLGDDQHRKNKRQD